MTFPFPTKLPVGAVLDDYYEITGHLGAGGFAEVYAGVQRDTGMEIAIKILRPLSNPASTALFRQRFLQEAKVAARIKHPNVVTILACRQNMTLRLPGGAKGDFERFYIVMDRLRGSTLEDTLLEKGPMSPRRALPLMIACLDGLAEGHELGIVHKDMKPTNLFLTDPGTRVEILKILDFGIARVGQTQDERLTQTGKAVFTPQYAAPEYIEHLIATPSLDVYQMGLIICEMLTGEAVVPEGSVFTCMITHTQGVEVPAQLLTSPIGPVLARATALDHTARYPDAAAFCAALEALDPNSIPDLTRQPAPTPPDDPEDTQEEPPPPEPEPAPVRKKARVPTINEADLRPPPEPDRHTAPPAPAAKKRSVLPLVLSGIALMGVVGIGAIVGGVALYKHFSQGDGPGSGPATSSLCGSPKACFEKGRDLRRVTPENRDFDKAVEFFEEACDKGEARGCGALGEMYYLAQGVEANPDKSVAYSRRGCDGGDAVGCSHLGYMYHIGHGVERDPKKVFKYSRKGCEGDYAPGCGNLGAVYEMGWGTDQDDKKAVEFYKKACELGGGSSCASLAFRYDRGQTLKKSTDKARTFYRKALRLSEKHCQRAEPDACSDLANLYYEGKGVRRDLEKAFEFYQQSCEEGSPGGCINTANLLYIGEGTDKDLQSAFDHYAKACKGGHAQGCTVQGILIAKGEGADIDLEKAADFYHRGCDGGDPEGCFSLGVAYSEGKGVDKSGRKGKSYYREAFELFDDACRAGGVFQCTRVALMYERGFGIKKSLDKARKFYKKGCKGGDKIACEASERLKEGDGGR